MARPARVCMRARKPCLRARRRLFGWKVRLDTVDSLCGHEQPTARQKPPGEVAVPNVKRCVEIAVRLRSWSAFRVQRLRQLALDQAARCPAGAVLSDVRRYNRRKDGVKTTRICPPRPNQHAHFFPGAIGYPRNYNGVFFPGGAGNPPRTLREIWEYVDSCSTRRVIHKNPPGRSFDSPRSEQVTMKQSPQSHSLGMHRPVDNCEVRVETSAQNLLFKQVRALQNLAPSYPQGVQSLWTNRAAKVSTPVDNSVEQQVTARRAGEQSCGLHM